MRPWIGLNISLFVFISRILNFLIFSKEIVRLFSVHLRVDCVEALNFTTAHFSHQRPALRHIAALRLEETLDHEQGQTADSFDPWPELEPDVECAVPSILEKFTSVLV